MAQFKACEAAGITVYVPVQRTGRGGGAVALYPRESFSYDVATDRYRCQQRQWLERKQIMRESRHVIYATRDRATCAQCPARGQCTHAAQHTVSRHLDEAVYGRAQARLAQHPDMMAICRQTVEHPFGKIKERILGNARLRLR